MGRGEVNGWALLVGYQGPGQYAEWWVVMVEGNCMDAGWSVRIMCELGDQGGLGDWGL